MKKPKTKQLEARKKACEIQENDALQIDLHPKYLSNSNIMIKTYVSSEGEMYSLYQMKRLT